MASISRMIRCMSKTALLYGMAILLSVSSSGMATDIFLADPFFTFLVMFFWALGSLLDRDLTCFRLAFTAPDNISFFTSSCRLSTSLANSMSLRIVLAVTPDDLARLRVASVFFLSLLETLLISICARI